MTPLPWSSDAGGVTLLRCLDPGAVAAKRLFPVEGGAPDIGCSVGSWFSAHAVKVDDTGDLCALLAALEGCSELFVIRGRMKREHAPAMSGPRRLMPADGDHPGVFEAQPRRWAALDFDSAPCPGEVDPTDPVMAGGATRRLLPSWARARGSSRN